MKMFLLIFFCVFRFGYCENESFDVVVLGSGSSGLAAASALVQGGMKIALVESSFDIGGSLRVFTKKGASGLEYEFDSGMHVLTNDGRIFEKVTQTTVTMNPLGDVIDHVYINRTSDPLELPKGIKKFQEYLISAFPEEKKAIEDFSKRIAKKKSILSLEYLLDDVTNNEELKYALSYMKDYTDCTPFPIPIYRSILRWSVEQGAAFPSGSAKNIVEGARKVVQDGGGKIFTNCPALKLIIEEQVSSGETENIENVEEEAAEANSEDEEVDLTSTFKIIGVETKCGTFSTNHVISTIGLRKTFDPNFIDPEVLEKLEYGTNISESLIDSFPAMLYYLAFNASNDILEFPKANVWYKSFDDEEEPKETDQETEQTCGQNSEKYFDPKNVLMTSLSARDPEYPSDRSDFFIMSFLTPNRSKQMEDSDFLTYGNFGVDYYDVFSEWEATKSHERPKEYYDLKQKFEGATLEWFFEMFPKSKEHLDLVITATPLTVRDYLGHHRGSAYGVSVQFFDYDWLGKNPNDAIETDILGLYLSGQDVNGAGVQLNMMHGVQAAEIIVSKVTGVQIEKKKKKKKRRKSGKGGRKGKKKGRGRPGRPGGGSCSKGGNSVEQFLRQFL